MAIVNNIFLSKHDVFLLGKLNGGKPRGCDLNLVQVLEIPVQDRTVMVSVAIKVLEILGLMKLLKIPVMVTVWSW